MGITGLFHRNGNELNRGDGTHPGHARPAAPAASAGPCVQALESRTLLSFGPAGPEFRVNTTTTDAQQTFGYTPGESVASDADGDFVVTWSGYGQDGSDWGVYAQRYDAAGVARGGEFRVNQTTTGPQYLSKAAMDADGDFVITWTSQYRAGDPGDVYARRYDAAGAARGGEFLVNQTTAGNQSESAAAMDADGDFVVTWTRAAIGRDEVYARRYDAQGVARGGEFRVNTSSNFHADDSTAAMDDDGDFVVVWNSLDQDGSFSGVYAQRYGDADRPPPAASVAARHVFYNNSAFDGNNPAANTSDDAAVATDKRALLPGQTASAANVSSYSRGINGVMIDVLNLPPATVSGGLLGVNDVAVRTTSPTAPNTWASGPAPSSVSVRPGPNGGHRVTLIWSDNAIANRWAEVKLLANADTGLAAPDVFRLGNLIGDADGSRAVNLGDFGALRQDFGRTGLSIANGRADFNRDGAVNLADFGLLRGNFGKSVPATPPALSPSASSSSSFAARLLADADAGADKEA